MGRNLSLPLPGSGDFITSFPTIENPLNQGGLWNRGKEEGLLWTTPQVTANGCVASTGPTPNRYDDNIAVLKAPCAPNQFAKGTLYKEAGYDAGGGKHEVELLLRGTISANFASFFECSIGMQTSFGPYGFIVLWNGPENNFTTLSDPANGTGSYVNTPTAMMNGDRHYADISTVGGVTTIRLLQNDIVIISITNSSIASGTPGLGHWVVDGATIDKMGLRDYRSGALP